MTKLKDMKKNQKSGLPKHVDRFKKALGSETARRWMLIGLAVFIVFIMVFSAFMTML